MTQIVKEMKRSLWVVHFDTRLVSRAQKPAEIWECPYSQLKDDVNGFALFFWQN
jgi:hypothetical protein